MAQVLLQVDGVNSRTYYLNSIILVAIFSMATLQSTQAQCPWSRELVDLHSDCVCAYNSVQRLSIQCSPVNFLRLTAALRSSVQNIPIDLLYINNSTLDVIPEAAFRNLDIQSLHISRSRIRNVHPKAFKGLEHKLSSLSLPDNHLPEVPTESLVILKNLQQLDLSNNNITTIQRGSFDKIPLATLKLADNRLTIEDGAFQGLEGTLKNLNLKGAQLDQLPRAIRNLSVLAFLDLAQNKISGLEAGSLASLHTLTALNLERNKISGLREGDFVGVNDTLSSLSLLNNQLEEFPKEALSTLTELRVLDLGFNRLRTLPDTAFQANPLLTLLALDGNPMETIPEAAFAHLSTILRGLSIGGSNLVCDCRVRWIAQWIKEHNLQVTSRERNPQFCGKPAELRRKSFLQISPDELICDDESILTTKRVLVTTTTATTQARITTITGTISPTTKGPRKHSDRNEANSFGSIRPSSSTTVKVFSPAQETTPYSSSKGPGLSSAQQSGPPLSVTPSRPLTVHSRPNKNSRVPFPVTEDVKIVDAYRHDSSVVIEWESQLTNILGFQVVYRYFGDSEFKRGQRLTADQRRYVLHNLPSAECLVVCVVTLEDTSNLSVDAIPYSQCRELKTERQSGSRTAELDKIVIGASAAVCGIIIIAVLIFACCYHRNRKKPPPPPHLASPSHSPKANGLPALKSEHEWETISMYSGRSIPRARMYHMDPSGNGSVNQSFVLDDQRSHISHYSHLPNGYPKSAPSRPTADGQSHRSYSQLSSRFAAAANGLGNPELRKSQQSLSQLSGHHSFIGSHMSVPKQKKSRSSNGRLTSASSLHSLTEYDSDWNGPRLENWKDNEVDIYVGQNHVAPTHGKYRKDYGPR